MQYYAGNFSNDHAVFSAHGIPIDCLEKTPDVKKSWRQKWLTLAIFKLLQKSSKMFVFEG